MMNVPRCSHQSDVVGLVTMDFDTVADELYAGDLAEFVSARNAAAKAAKAGGDAELATRIRELRKPTTAAAIVNRLARDGSEMLPELAELGAELRTAHAQLAGADMRELARQRNELIRRIMAELPAMSDTVAREVEATLEALAADEGTAALALAGRLTSVAHQDADQWLMFGAAAPAAPASQASDRPAKLVEKAAEPARPKRSARVQKAEDDRRDQEERERVAREEREQARAERERLRREAAERAKERAVAERDFVRTQRTAQQATARVEELRERLAEAEERAEQATADFETAKAAFEQADEAATAAQEAVDAR
jgi:hypothetical protein